MFPTQSGSNTLLVPPVQMWIRPEGSFLCSPSLKEPRNLTRCAYLVVQGYALTAWEPQRRLAFTNSTKFSVGCQAKSKEIYSMDSIENGPRITRTARTEDEISPELRYSTHRRGGMYHKSRAIVKDRFAP